MQWDDVEEICGALAQTQPRADFRGMSELEIMEVVTQLPGFTGDPDAFTAGHIEAIRAGTWWGA